MLHRFIRFPSINNSGRSSTAAAAAAAAAAASSSLCDLRFCSTSEESSATTPQQQQPRIANLLDVEFDDVGSGRFVAVGSGRPPLFHNTVSIILTCDVSERMLALRESWKEQESNETAISVLAPEQQQQHQQQQLQPKEPTVSKSAQHKLLHRKRGVRSMGHEDEESRMPTPVSFSMFIENFGAPASANAAEAVSSSVPSLPMCVTASCQANCTLSIDTISFINSGSIRDVLERTVDGAIVRRELYHGPRLHQGHLAEYALGTGFGPSPVDPPRQHRALPLKWMARYSATASSSAPYGHSAVHTVPPRLYDALFKWFEAVGIDDCFAADVRRVALEVQEREFLNWKETAQAETKRKIHR